MTSRPSFARAWAAFAKVNIPVADVGAFIGGKVADNVKEGIFQNACPIRMSYVLNQTGVPVPKHGGYATVSGADGKWYMFRVLDMMNFLTKTFGKPDRLVKSPGSADFSGSQGILVVKGHGWSNAVGHVTLWNGALCSDHCHLAADPDNGSFVPETASLWALQ